MINRSNQHQGGMLLGPIHLGVSKLAHRGSIEMFMASCGPWSTCVVVLGTRGRVCAHGNTSVLCRCVSVRDLSYDSRKNGT